MSEKDYHAGWTCPRCMQFVRQQTHKCASPTTIECSPLVPRAQLEALKAELAKVREELAAAREVASRYYKVMDLLRDMRLPHGTCQPRERMACTHCNAKDELDRIVSEYRGAPVYLAARAALGGEQPDAR